MGAAATMDRLVELLLARHAGPNRRPVAWLGAGCSVYDGIPAAADLVQRAVPDWYQASWGSPQYTFDEYISKLPDPVRSVLFDRFFKRELRPDSPYHHLVRLLRDRWVDMVFTFNVDRLLEMALARAELQQDRDYRLINVAGEREREVLLKLARPGPRICIVKLHGDHSGINCMTSEEITRLDPRIAELVEHHSRQPALVCGYTFFHLDVLKSFSHEGGPVFYVNPTFPDAPMVLSILKRNQGGPALVVDGDAGRFENFLPALLKRLPPCTS